MDRDDPVKPPGHPIQRQDLDLSQDPRKSENAARLGDDPSTFRSPAAMMRSMGFDPTKTMTPLQFLTAVYNDDLDLLFKDEKKRTRYKNKGGLAMSYRIEAAKTASKFIHMQMPQVQIQKGSSGFGDELAAAAAKGGERIRTKRVILETIERISPDVPLPPASYPPVFADIQGEVIDMPEGSADGDMDYNPDEDDDDDTGE